MKPTRFVIACIAILAMLPALTGCRTGKPASRANAGSAPIPEDISLQTPEQRYEALCAGYGNWQDVSMPVKISLNSPQSISFSARAVMKHGEWVSISVRMLGFELASVWLDNDSVHAIDKYHKMYLSESVSKIFAGTGVSISDIQDMILGRGFLLTSDGGTFTAGMAPRLKFDSTETGMLILPNEKPQGIDYGFILYPDANDIMAATVASGETRNGVITYTDFQTVPGAGSFAGTANITVTSGKKAEATLKWNLSSAKWNTGEKPSWKRPSGYTRISAERLLKVLSSM